MRLSRLVLGLAVAFSGLLPASAAATFPGRNGLIAFDVEVARVPELCEDSGCEGERVGDRIEAIKPRTGRLVKLGLCERRCHELEPRWSPDGRQLAFLRFTDWGLPTQTGSVVIKPRDRPEVSHVVEGNFTPLWSADGKRLVVDVGSKGISTVAVDGSSPRTIPVRGVDTTRDVDWSVRNVLVFRRGFSLWVVRPDGSSLRRILKAPDAPVSPSFSPDGRRVLYTLPDPRAIRSPSLHIVNVRTGKDRVFAKTAHEGTWSPDGRQIAFLTDNNPFPYGDHHATRESVHIARVDGSHGRRVYRSRPGLGSLTWQPRRELK